MVSEPYTRQCASKDFGPPEKWIVRSHIGWKREQRIPYKSVEISPYQMRSKNFKGKPRKDNIY